MDTQIFIRVLAGSGLFCLIASVGLYLLSRVLSRKRVEVMKEILHPVSNVALVLSVIALVGTGLLMLLRYQEAAIWFISVSIILELTIFLPATCGHIAACNEIRKRERAEKEMRRRKEGLAGG